MPLQLEHADIAGAAVAVVRNGKLLLAKGYGYWFRPITLGSKES